MVRIVFVHGMRHEKRPKEEIESLWFDAFIDALTRTRVARGRRDPLPSIERELVYWGDLFAGPQLDTYPLQGIGDDVVNAYYAFVRETMHRIDRVTDYDPLARPASVMARLIDRQVRQTAMYMANAPTARLETMAAPNVYDQIQYRFRMAVQRGADIVIGHSLGSVIAYEGLCQSGRRVPVLLTIGSPIGVRRLIYDKLRPAEPEPRSSPNVREWINVSNLADAMVVPVPEIAKLFRAPVRDVVIQRGKAGIRSLTINHRFVEYLKDERVGAVVADAFDTVIAGQSR